jgi:purine-cytosine permease-like protein
MPLADNEAMEDFSLRYTPSTFRKWSPLMVFLTCLVGLSAMAGYALDAAYVNGFGFANAVSGFGVATALTVPITLTIAFYLARHHIDIDLLTRGAGFGYLGSTVTSLVYATFTLIFLAYEGAIMAQALTTLTHLDIHISYVLVAAVMIPLTIYGMTFTTKFQAWTWPLWIALIGLAIGSVATSPHAFSHMVHLHAVSLSATAVSATAVFGIAAAQLSGVAQIGEQGDYLRFMPDPDESNRKRWRLAVIFGGPGMSLFFVLVFFASTLLVAYAEPRIGPVRSGLPVDLFTSVYQGVVGSHAVALALAGVLVLLSQVKINIMNTYSGSLSWSNFFSRILHRHPGRAVWVVLQCALAVVLMELNIFDHIVTVLGWYSNAAIAWIGVMFSDLVINKKLLKLAPSKLEFHRAHLFNFNPVGFGSMLIAGSISMAVYYKAFGVTAASYSAFIAFGIALVLPPILAWATRGAWYIARTSELPDDCPTLMCSRCEQSFEIPDMATCPFYHGYICSLCCSTEGSCHDACKPSAWIPVRAPRLVDPPAPKVPAGAGVTNRVVAQPSQFPITPRSNS